MKPGDVVQLTRWWTGIHSDCVGTLGYIIRFENNQCIFHYKKCNSASVDIKSMYQIFNKMEV